LGRGLAALLGTDDGGYEGGSLELAELSHVAVDQIDPNPWQPRRAFDPEEIATLADSLRQHGMLQPVLVRPHGDRYQLIAGERRMRAAIEAQLHEIPARVLELDDQRVCEIAMVENLQREDLNAIDKAHAFRRYREVFGATPEELAGRLGLDRTTVTNFLRLLELSEEVQALVVSKQISAGHARSLLGFKTAEEQVAAARKIVAEGLSVRQTEAMLQEAVPTTRRVRADGGDSGTRAGSVRAPHVLELEEHLKNRFQVPVLIKVKGPHRGQIVIDFHTQEEYDRVTGLIR
jgi:ParB family chromosome partitioning protein